MKLGICINPLDTLAWPSLPCDYLEANVQTLLVPESSDADFTRIAARLTPLASHILAANGFLPGDLKVTGPSVDHARLATYADTAFRRAASLGVRFIVFGSGGARRIPDDWSNAKGFEQFIHALEICAPLAQKHDLILLVEPLNRAECNLVNTIVEGAVAVARVNHPHIRLLVDFYHMLRNDESPGDIVKVRSWIAHAHVAEKAGRTAPGVAGDDFRPFFTALNHAGYTGALSLECTFGSNVRSDATASLAFIRQQLA